MKRYTLKNLPQSTQPETEDMAFAIAKSRMQYVWYAFKDLVLNDTLYIQIVAPLLVVAAVVMLFWGRPGHSIFYLAILIYYYGRFFLAINKVYTRYSENNILPLITREGPVNVMWTSDNQRYVRIEKPCWEEVKRITFYDDYFVVQMIKGSDSGIFFMWTDDMPNVQTSVLNMWRNALDAKEKGMTMTNKYSETERREITEAITEEFGESHSLLRDKMTTDMPIDILIIPPSEDEERDYYTLCTVGVGSHRMNVPDDYRLGSMIAEHIELLMYLPADWDLSMEGMSDQRNQWPINLLIDFARVTIDSDEWITWGNTFTYHGLEDFAPDEPFAAALLLSPQPDVYDAVSCHLSTRKSVDFFQVFPLTHSEWAFKMACTENDNDISATARLLEEHINADLDNWMDFALSRFNYRKYL